MECKETIPFLVREGRLKTSFGDTFQKKTKTKTKTQKKYKHKERWSERKRSHFWSERGDLRPHLETHLKKRQRQRKNTNTKRDGV